MPTFCRHNRFIERCPICRETLPGARPAGGRQRSRPGRSQPGQDRGGAAQRSRSASARGSSHGAAELRIYADGARRGRDDGFQCELVPGLRSSEDALALAQEIAFSSGRLLTLASAPPGLYGQASAWARQGELERACWACFLIAYLGPLQGEDPFDGAQRALERMPGPGSVDHADLEGIPTGPRSCHPAGAGMDTLLAYRRWSEKAGGQALALLGDPSWSPERRFERILERLGLLGFARWGRYDLLVTLGRLAILQVHPSSLHLVAAGARHQRAGHAAADLTVAGAKRVFGIGDPFLLERRALELAQACAVPIETLDQALASWASPERAAGGVPAQTCDRQALARARAAIGVGGAPKLEEGLERAR